MLRALIVAAVAGAAVAAPVPSGRSAAVPSIAPAHMPGSDHDYLPCFVPGFPRGPGVNNQLNNTGGFNAVQIYPCAASSADQCTIGSAAVAPCTNLLFPGNASTYFNITVDANFLVLQFYSTQPFSFHGISSTPPVVVPWPSASSPVNVPYPVEGVLLCDSSADCPTGVPCVTSQQPSRCQALTPSPAPPTPSASAPPSPSPQPASVQCNISGVWYQPHPAATASGTSTSTGTGSAQQQVNHHHPATLGLTRYGHSADAIITINMTAGTPGAFIWSCTSGHALCPGNTSALNGTGVLSSGDRTFTLTAYNTSVGKVVGLLNNTFTCNLITLLMPVAGLEWQLQTPKSTPVLDTEVSVASFLGAGATQMVATGVAILSAPPAGQQGKAVVAVAANGQAAYPGITPQLLLNGTAASNGTLLILSADVSLPSASPLTVLAVYKLGCRLDHVRANAAGQVAVAGDFGVALLSGLSATATAATAATPAASASVVWHDPLLDVEPGSCGVCCSLEGNTNTTCRLDVGEDGVVAAYLAAATVSNGAWLWAAWSPAGKRFAQEARTGASLTTVAVDSAHSQLAIGWFYDSNTGKEPMVMPAVDVWSYAAAVTSGADLSINYQLMPWSATVYRSPGPCNGNVADGRILDMRFGRDGVMLFAGRSDGGDSPFMCGLRNPQRVTPLVSYDGYTSPYNMQSQAITNMLRVDPVVGEVIVGQQMVARLPSGPQRANTLMTLAAHSDEAGNLYLLQLAACCIANMGNLTLNGQPLAPNVDATVLQIVSPSFTHRIAWTHFIAAVNTTGGGGGPVDVDVRGGAVAVVMTSGADMVTAQALAGSSSNVGGAPVGYLVLMPTVTAAHGPAAGGPAAGGDAHGE